MYVSARYINIIRINEMPSWFISTLLMASYKAQLKSNGDKASPCFNPFLIGNMSDKFLPTRFLL